MGVGEDVRHAGQDARQEGEAPVDVVQAVGRHHPRTGHHRQGEHANPGRIDVVQVDLTRCGGFTEALKIAALAWDRGLPVANHGFTTYVNVTAALHWLNSIPNALICEFVAEEETNLREFVTHQKLRAEDGYLRIPDAPGLGIDLDEGAIRQFRME